MTGNGTFHVGNTISASSNLACNLELRGTDSFDIDMAGMTFTSVKFNAPGLTISSIGSANWTTGRWYIEPNTGVIMAAGLTVTVTTVLAGDIDGSAGKDVQFTSSTPGTYWNYDNPVTIQTADWINITDSNASNPISVNKANSVNGGHNSNWNFKVVKHLRFRR
jgi:hypothetical protein